MNDNEIYDINDVKIALLRYTKEDKWNRNTEYHLGFNDQAQDLIDDIANGDFGFASDVAKSVQKYNYSISEKQAYVIAKTAVEFNIVSKQRQLGQISIFYTKEEKRKSDEEIKQQNEWSKAKKEMKKERVAERKKQINNSINIANSLNIGDTINLRVHGVSKVLSKDKETITITTEKGEIKKLSSKYLPIINN